MLKIAEYAKAGEVLRQKAYRALDEAGVSYEKPCDESDKIRLVFAGQYSAGKSTIMKMLTGRDDIATGAEITTQEAHTYEWMGLEVIDTPGVHTTLRPDHDEISYKAIASADMLVFVVTNELFDSHIAEHFRKLAIEKDKASEMILVVNKMERAAEGNTKVQQDIIREDLRKVLAPYTPEQLHLSFLDAQSYLDSLEEREEDPELADELLERSGYNQFIETLNKFVEEKSMVSKLTTELYVLDNLLDKAIYDLQPKASDEDISALEESQIQQRHILVEARNSMQQEITDIFDSAAAKLRELGVTAANSIEAGREQAEIEADIEQYISQASDITDRCQIDADDSVKVRLAELGQSLDEMEKSEFSQNLKVRLVDKYDNIPDAVKMVFVTTDNIERAGDMILGSVVKTGVPEVLKLTGDNATTVLRLTGSSDKLVRNAVRSVGTRVGYKFKPYEATKVAKNISKGVTRGSTIMGAVGIGLDIYLQLKEDYDEALRKEALRSNRQNVRSTFNSAAKELEDFSRQYVKENVYRPMEQSIASIDANIQNIRDTRDGKSSACVRLENIQTECSKLIEKLHQAALSAEA